LTKYLTKKPKEIEQQTDISSNNKSKPMPENSFNGYTTLDENFYLSVSRNINKIAPLIMRYNQKSSKIIFY